MPHQCTACGYTFADGSKDMLGGCPDCGGNKFQFYPEGTDVPDEPPGDESPPEPEDPGSTASTVGRAATKVRDFVSSDSAGAGSPDADPTGTTSSADSTDSAPDDSAVSASDDPPTSAQNESPTSESNESTAPASDNSPDDGTVLDDSSGDEAKPDPNAPWPDSSDAADPIRKGGFQDDTDDTDDADPVQTDDDGIIDADARAAADAVTDAEDGAQSEARSDTASDSELAATRTGEEAAADEQPPADSPTDDGPLTDDGLSTDEGRVVSEPSGDDADLAELREQLNDQFESIKILEPGQYELNLMELYDRDEYIIALQENGRYVIQMPEQWMSDRETER